MSDTQPNTRVRVNAKQTSKGEWYFDATFEDEALNVDTDNAAQRLLETVDALERAFKAAGKTIAGAA